MDYVSECVKICNTIWKEATPGMQGVVGDKMKEVQGVIEASLKRDAHLLRVAVFNLHKELKKRATLNTLTRRRAHPL